MSSADDAKSDSTGARNVNEGVVGRDLVQAEVVHIYPESTASLFRAGVHNPSLSPKRPFRMLHYRSRVVPFIPDASRKRQLEELLAWATEAPQDAPDVRVRILTGPAGAGKSRLAAELCEQLHADGGWHAGFVDYDRVGTTLPQEQPLFAVCDYPEQDPAKVSQLIDSFQKLDLQYPVRLLLVSRSPGSWTDRITGRDWDLDDIADEEVRLRQGEFDAEARLRHVKAAYEAFTDSRFEPAEGARCPDVDDPRYDTPLLIHIAAFLGAQGIEVPSPDDSKLREELLSKLLKREARGWLAHTEHGGTKVFTDGELAQQALCVTTLTGPARGHATELLRVVPDLKEEPRINRSRIAKALATLYPGEPRPIEPGGQPEPHVAPVEPDLIAAYLLHATPDRFTIVNALLASDILAEHPAYHARLIHSLTLAADQYPEVKTDLHTYLATSLGALIGAAAPSHDGSAKNVETVLVELLSERLHSLVTAAVDLAANNQDLTAARELAVALELPACRNHPTLAEAAADVFAEDRIPHPHTGLSGLSATVAILAVDHYRVLAEDNPAAHLPRLARSLSNLGNRLSALGRRGEALSASQEAVETYRALVETHPATHQPHLAASLNNLGAHLSTVGHRDEALSASEEAVDIRRALAEAHPDAHLPDLAMSLTNLGLHLSKAGRLHEALTVGQEAVDIQRTLTENNPAAHLPNLAAFLNNLGLRLSEVGRRDEALTATQEAVNHYRTLTDAHPDAHPDAHLPNLTASLNNLGYFLGELGRHDDALTAAQEAVDIYKKLAAAEPAVFSAKLRVAHETLRQIQQQYRQQ